LLNTLKMEKEIREIDRRTALKTYSLAMLGLAIPSIAFSNDTLLTPSEIANNGKLPKHFPNLDPEMIAEVVGKSHFDLDRVKQLVDHRPELSRSVHEWRFGDFESAIGAASHVGRRDIVQYLISKGARPTLFTFAMLGAFDVVKSAITAVPGIQNTTGPHGISLLDHAYAGERMKDKMTPIEINKLKKTIDYLEELGDAGSEQYLTLSDEEQQKYLGNYKYGEGALDGFTIDLNMRKIISLGPIDGFGGALYKLDNNTFTYNGTPSIKISFDVYDDVVKSLTLTDPDFKVVAKKIS